MNVEFVSNVYLVNHHKVIQCNIRDITERKLIAEALQKAHNELERQVEERTVELRTALSEIKTMKEQLEAENIYFRQENKININSSIFSGKAMALNMFSIERSRSLPRTQRSSSLVRPVRGRN